MKKLKALIISNGIEGLESLFQSNEQIEYQIVEIAQNFNPDFSGFDILIAPNGTDHVAFYRIREKIKAFLDEGNTLFCFDGWFTDWIPGNRWVMDNSQKTIDVRYKIKNDPFGMSQQFSAEDLSFSHGISGWWTCGYIEPAAEAIVLLEDTWERPLLVLDNKTTKGLMVLSASGPLADVSYGTTDDNKAYQAMTNLYRSIIQFVQQSKILVPCQIKK